jgi:hypothetical protein
MTSTALSVFSGLFADTLACTRCGSGNVFPSPGPFAAFGVLVGLARHHCRSCGRAFWAKASAEYRCNDETEPEAGFEDDALLDTPSPEAASIDLDLDLSPPPPEPVDLAALDAEFERRCAADEPRRRRG